MSSWSRLCVQPVSSMKNPLQVELKCWLLSVKDFLQDFLSWNMKHSNKSQWCMFCLNSPNPLQRSHLYFLDPGTKLCSHFNGVCSIHNLSRSSSCSDPINSGTAWLKPSSGSVGLISNMITANNHQVLWSSYASEPQLRVFFHCSTILFHKFVLVSDTLKIPVHCLGTPDTLKKVICLSILQALFLLLCHFHMNLNIWNSWPHSAHWSLTYYWQFSTSNHLHEQD